MAGPGWEAAWLQKANERLPFASSANKVVTGQGLGANVRQVERDNVANFAGKLD